MKTTIKALWTLVVIFGLFVFSISIVSTFIQIEVVERIIADAHVKRCGPDGLPVQMAGPRAFERRCIKKEVFLD